MGGTTPQEAWKTQAALTRPAGKLNSGHWDWIPEGRSATWDRTLPKPSRGAAKAPLEIRLEQTNTWVGGGLASAPGHWVLDGAQLGHQLSLAHGREPEATMATQCLIPPTPTR